MTPEEQADKIIQTLRTRQNSWTGDLRSDIIDAIHEAVKAERETCAEIAWNIRARILSHTPDAPVNAEVASLDIWDAIRARQ